MHLQGIGQFLLKYLVKKVIIDSSVLGTVVRDFNTILGNFARVEQSVENSPYQVLSFTHCGSW